MAPTAAVMLLAAAVSLGAVTLLAASTPLAPSFATAPICAADFSSSSACSSASNFHRNACSSGSNFHRNCDCALACNASHSQDYNFSAFFFVVDGRGRDRIPPSAKSMVANHGLVTRIYATSSSSILSDALAPQPSQPCQTAALANLVVLVCSGTVAKPAPECCATLLQGEHSGSLYCLCIAASSPEMINAGYTVSEVLTWYAACGGRLSVHSDTAFACSAESTQSGVVSPLGVEQKAVQDESKTVTPLPTPPLPTPPLPTPSATQAAAARPLVVVIPDHEPGWPWWAVIVAIAVTMVFVAVMSILCICCCGRLIRWISDFVMAVYLMGRRSAADSNPISPNHPATNNATRDIVADTEYQNPPPQDLPHGRELADPRIVIGRPVHMDT